jgi:hypothetical protein
MSRLKTRLPGILAAMLVVGLIAGLTTAPAGAGDSSATAAKKKKKKCPNGTQKVLIKKKNGKKKRTCRPLSVAPNPAPAPTGTANLAISPGSFTYPTVQHGTCTVPPDADCNVQAFTVTNTGTAPSGVPATSIVETNNPIMGDPPGFVVSTNTCTAAVPAGGSCTVSAYFKPTSNANPQPYTAVLHVAGTPGGDATASLSGTGN